MTRKSSTEGTATDTVREAATMADGPGLNAYTQTNPPPARAEAPHADLLLPSAHIDYAALMENELTNRVHAMESGIAALEGVLAGKQSSHNTMIAEKNAAFEVEKADLLRRITNLKTALKMAKDGIAAKDAPL